MRACYYELLGIGLVFLNIRSGPCHLNIRTELVFYTTSEPSGSGPAATYLNVVTVYTLLDKKSNVEQIETILNFVLFRSQATTTLHTQAMATMLTYAN